MTRFVWDKYSKDFFQDMVLSYGQVEVGKNVAPEIKEIDVWFTPDNPSQIPPELGLLGRFCQTPCLFEVYRNPVTLKQISDCLSKRFAVLEELERESKRRKERLRAKNMPRLWILTPTASPRILEPFSGRMRPDWGEGDLFSGGRVGKRGGGHPSVARNAGDAVGEVIGQGGDDGEGDRRAGGITPG